MAGVFPLRPFQLDRKSARSWIALVALAAFVALVSACSGHDDGARSSTSALAQAGRWTLPANVQAAGEKVRVTYAEAPKWTGTAACAGKLKIGGARLGEYLVDRFAVVTSVGGYACRRNTADTSRMSVHGTGRALDVFIPKTGGAADNGQGDKVANWLVMNAQRIGVQLVIWDRTIWRSNGTNDAAYGGPHPHDDHLHVELSAAAATASTPWFADPDGDEDSDASMEGGAEGGRSDAGTARPDAARPDMDGGTVDANKKDAAPVDPSDDDHADEVDAGPDANAPANDPKDTTKEPPPATSGTTPPSEGLESAGDEPGETDSLEESTSPKRSAPAAAEDEEPIPTDGCSATPRSSSGSAPLTGGGLALALGLVAMLRRKRR